MPVKVEREEKSMTFKLSGEIDHHAAKSLREEIDRCARAYRPEQLTLDFKGVEFMDSSGIGLVLGRYRLMQELDGTLRLINMPAHLRKVMRLAGIENLGISMDGGETE
ncbi:MAG: STAS domain-containing protein [Angelakisella sp.]